LWFKPSVDDKGRKQVKADREWMAEAMIIIGITVMTLTVYSCVIEVARLSLMLEGVTSIHAIQHSQH